MLALPEGSRWYALFPCGEHATTEALRDHLFELRKKGFNRLFQDGRALRILHAGIAARYRFLASPLFVLVDRLAIAPDLHQRLVDTVEICYREAGEVIFESAAGGEQLRFNEKFQCKTCGMEFAEPEPILFSFNSARSAPARAARASATPSISTWTW